jgi:hypothetical protein
MEEERLAEQMQYTLGLKAFEDTGFGFAHTLI